MKPFSYHAAADVKEAVKLLSRHKGDARLLAGGSDLIPQMKSGLIAPPAVIDIKHIKGLSGVSLKGNRVEIGPLTTLTEIAENDVIGRKLPILAETALDMASPQVRNRATIGGNISNAAPSADMAPPLIALGARVQIRTRRGARTMNIEDFFTGPRQSVICGKGIGILTKISVPVPPRRARIVYKPLYLREAMDLSIVSAAVYVERDRKTVTKARVALGAVAPIPLRVKKVEKILKNTKGEDDVIEQAAMVAAVESKPISDVRATKGYRREMVAVIVRRALKEVLK